MPGLVKRRASGMIIGTALRDLKRAVEADRRGRAEPTGDDAVDEPTTADRRADADDADAETATPAADADCRIPTRSTSTTWAPRSGRCRRRRSLESVLSELLGAVPEVRDHVLAAADALLDAAKALIDAADRVVRQQARRATS